LNSLYKVHGDIPLLLSGGMDSTFMLRSLIELGIKPRTITFSFSENNDSYECELVKKLYKKYDFYEPEFFYVDLNKLINFCGDLISNSNEAYPMLHGFVVHYFLKDTFKDKFLTGMGSEYKLITTFSNKSYIKMPYGPQQVKKNNPDRLFNFTTSRTFLSYLRHEKFLSNFKKPVPEEYQSPDEFYIRDQIYLDCYADIDLVTKEFNIEHYNPYIERFVAEIKPMIKNTIPTIYTTKHYKFNVDNYFTEKNITY
jgi:hypothetical protein